MKHNKPDIKGGNARYSRHSSGGTRINVLPKTLFSRCLFVVAVLCFGLSVQAETVRIIGDSLHGTPSAGYSVSDHLRSYGWQVTCECRPGEALIGHSWHTDHITEDTVVLALLSNDACGSKLVGIRDQWFAVYLEGVKRVVTKLVRDGKRVIFVLPTLSNNHAIFHNEDLHLFRYFGAMVAYRSGAELIDMAALGVPLGPDGLHYDASGTEIYAQHLHQQLLYGEP